MAPPVKKVDSLMIQDAEILFRNFAGREMPYNSEGDRNFVVILKPALAKKLIAEGWNVKELRPRDEGEEPKSYMQVAVNYGKGRPPRVVIMTTHSRVDLGADEVQMLDFAEIETVDLIINPYPWEVNGKSGIKAYLKTAYVTIHEDALDLKYAEDQNPTASSTANEAVGT